MVKQLLTLATAALLTTGCASIISGSNYPVTINSSPDGATFSIVNTGNRITVMKGVTPATVSLKAYQGYFDGADYTLIFE